MLYSALLIVHIFVCFVLVAVILLQAGRGGGLAETFGGGQSSIFGTRGAVYLTRATTGCAIVFMLTSLTLAILSAQRGRSLMERVETAEPQEPPPAGGTSLDRSSEEAPPEGGTSLDRNVEEAAPQEASPAG